MKALAIFSLVCPAIPMQNGEPARPALAAKEVLHYAVEWRLMRAGNARLSWNATAEPSGWQVSLHLESAGLVSKLHKVDDRYTAVLGRDLCAGSSHMNAHEGRRQRESKVTYDREARKARYIETDMVSKTVVDKKEIEVPACVHDVVGALYHLRTLSLEPGATVQVPVSDGKKSVSARVVALEREKVKTPAGTHSAMRYEVFLFNKVLYQRSAKLYVWLTDDDRKLPVQIQVRMGFTMGTVTFQLEKEERA